MDNQILGIEPRSEFLQLRIPFPQQIVSHAQRQVGVMHSSLKFASFQVEINLGLGSLVLGDGPLCFGDRTLVLGDRPLVLGNLALAIDHSLSSARDTLREIHVRLILPHPINLIGGCNNSQASCLQTVANSFIFERSNLIEFNHDHR